MKKIATILILLCIVPLLFSCATDEKTTQKDALTNFLSFYYNQYEIKDEVEAIFKPYSGELTKANAYDLEQSLEKFMGNYFDDALTAEGKELVLANRLIPDARVIDSPIVSAEIRTIDYQIAENQIEGTYHYTAEILYRYPDDTTEAQTHEGLIRAERKDDRYKIDYFQPVLDRSQ